MRMRSKRKRFSLCPGALGRLKLLSVLLLLHKRRRRELPRLRHCSLSLSHGRFLQSRADFDTLRYEDQFLQPDDEHLDHHFQKAIQNNIYESICMPAPLVSHQWVDLSIVRKKPDVFEGVLDLINSKDLMHILTYKHDWCEELIKQFYATCYLSLMHLRQFIG